MSTFKNLNELNKYLKKNPNEALKHSADDIIKLTCPMCKSIEKVKNLRNGYGKCLKCGTEFKIELKIDD